MLFSRRSSSVAWLIVGLGNPGKAYEGTRHNVGFAAVNYIAQCHDITVKRTKFDGLCGDGSIEGQRVALLKPQTFMNLSGRSVAKAAGFYRLLPKNVIVLCDDVALAPGVLRIRASGSAGGHNGLKSIIEVLGADFLRIRIGVGQKPHPDADMARWVLGRLAPGDAALVAERAQDIAAATALLVNGNIDDAMNKYNGEKR